jgi:hypothetical protein
MAMLAIAHERADDSIHEEPIPSEFGQYIFDLRDPFHKVVASAAGQYIVIDTAADWSFNATGLQRIHSWRVDLSPLSDSAAGNRSYGPADAPKLAISPGIQWMTGSDDRWHSLANESVETCQLLNASLSPGAAQFVLTYQLKKNAGTVEQRYRIDQDGVECTETFSPAAAGAPGAMRFIFPAMVSDGRADVEVQPSPGHLQVTRAGGRLALELLSAKESQFNLEGDRIPTHNGWVRAAVAELPSGMNSVRWRAKLSP